MPARKTLTTLLEQFHLKHGTRYDYSKVVYINDTTPVLIGCSVHGEFEQRPGNHLQGMGCPKCGFRKRAQGKTLTQAQCLERFKDAHESRYVYDKVVYKGQHTPVVIVCEKHGQFEQTPAVHWNGMGCPLCGRDRNTEAQRMTNDEFVARARRIHGDDTYLYDETNYVRGHDKVVIRCKTHGRFEQDPYNHLAGFGCRQCTPVGYSKAAVEWLTFMSLYRGIPIQHAGNGGEVTVPGTLYRPDGYSEGCAWEFDGDYYHGNPTYYASADPFPHSKTGTTFGDMFARTVKKRQDLVARGLVVVSIWESEWKRAKRAVVELQRAFRSNRSRKV